MIERLDGFQAVHPGWRQRLRDACADGGYSPGSTWRSYDLQARWYWCAQNGCPRGRGCHGTPGNCPGANPGGKSNHEWAEFVPTQTPLAAIEAAGLVVADQRPEGLLIPASLACDLRDDRGDDFAWLHRNAARYRIAARIARERWHFQPEELLYSYQTGSPFPPLITYLRAPIPPPDPWADLFVPILVI